MASFAVIKDGIVDNCIEAESLAIAEEVTGLTVVEYGPEFKVSIGYLYDNGVFTNPNPPLELIDEPLTEPVPVE
jgi:hypothetical protein